MRFLFGFALIVGGACGLAISLLSSIVVSSSLLTINGMELSLGLALFSIVAFLGGIYTLFAAS